MKSIKSRAIKLLLCIAIIIPLVIGSLSLSGINGFAGQGALNSSDDTAVAEAASTNTFNTGLPNGKKFQYTNITTGITMSGYASTNANFGSGMSDKVEVTVDSTQTIGTATNPYAISTKDDWQSFATYVASLTSGTNIYGTGKYFILNANLDYDGDQIPSLANFRGTFYGANHVIKNVAIGYDATINQAYTAAIFQTTVSASILDLTVDNYVMNTRKVHSAPLVANAGANTTIANCSTIGEINASDTIYASGSLKGFDTVAATSANSANYGTCPAFGGIIAHVNSTNIRIYKCSAKTDININTTYNSRDWFYGGIIGGGLSNSTSANIYDSYCSMNFDSVMGTGSSYFCIGGLIGYSAGGAMLAQNCITVFDAVVTGATQFAGALGCGARSTFRNCYSFYDFGNKNRTTGVVTRYKLGVGRDGSVTGSSIYAYTGNTTVDSNSSTLGLSHTASVTALWDRAIAALNPDIWLHTFLADNTDTTSPIDIFVKPVHVNPVYITYKYSNDDEIDLGVDDDGNQIENPIEYSVTEDGKTALPTIDAPTAGGTPDANRVFVGWTLDKDSATSTVYSVYSREIVGNVDAYPVWKINDFKVGTTGATSSASNIKDTVTITYTNDDNNNVVLTANISTACTLDAANRTYTWYKDGVKVSGETKSTITLKNVAESGKYTVQVTAVGKDDVLWRGDATSEEFAVTINRGTLALKPDSFAIDGTAYVGQGYDTVEFTATAIDSTTNKKVDGTFDWGMKFKVQLTEGKTVAENYILFTPDDSILNNYLAPSASSSTPSQRFDVSFTPDTFYLLFHITQFGNTDLKVPIDYDTAYSSAEVRDLFNAALAKYFESNPAAEAGVSGLAPKLGVPLKDGVPDAEGTVGDSEFIDEYSIDLPKMTKQLVIQITFAEHPYTINFDPNGGVLSSLMESSKEFDYNDLLKSYLKNPSYPTNTNYRFQYWYYEVEDLENGGTKEVKWDPDYDRVKQNVTLIAKWREVILTLQTISAEQYPSVKLIAQQSLKDGDIKVTAHYLDDQGEPYDEVLEFGDWTYTFVSATDRLLHIGSKINISYKYGSVTADCDLELDVNPIDLKTEDWDIYLDEESGTRKVVMRVTGNPVNLNIIRMIPDSVFNYIDTANIVYTYSNIAGTTVDPSTVVNRGIYRVKIDFPTYSDDYVAHSMYIELELKDVTKVFVEWTVEASYQYTGKLQHPTAVIKDADGVEILAKDWEYEFTAGDGISVMKGHSININLLNDAYEFDDSTTTYVIYEIQKALFDAPTVKDKIEYAGTFINLADHLDGFDPDLMEIVSGGTQMAVDSYTAIIKIKDDVSGNCQWANGAPTQIINWSIEKRTLTAIWSKSTFILADVGENGVNPKVTGFVGMYADDLAHFNFDTDLLYSGDLAKTEQGAYKISVKLNNPDFSQNYTLSENIECPFVIVMSADIKVITVVWNDIPTTGYVYNGEIQAPSLSNITVFYGDKDVTDEVLGLLTLGGDVYTSKWAGTYKATLTLDEDCGYAIISGFEVSYKIVKNQQGEGEKPDDGEINPGNPGNDGSDTLNKIKEFFEKLLASHFPLWQVIIMAVSALLALIFMIKAIQYGKRAKKAKGETKKIKAKAYAAFLPIFSTETVALGLSNQIWSIMAFAFVGLALLMFIIALITRHGWKKAELAKEAAIEEREERRFGGGNADNQERSNEFKELKEQLALMSSQQQSAAAPSSDSMALIEEMRREMEERRREDEERHRQEMDAMKMMFANMMGRQQGEEGFTYASMDDTDMLVQRVIAGLLPAVQQMMPEATAYLAAPQEQNEELLNIVAEQNEEIRNMSAQMSELQAQLAAMSQGADAIIMPDSSDDINALSAKMNELQEQIANIGNGTAPVNDSNNDEIIAEMNAMREQIANLGNQSVTVVAADNSDEMKAMSDEMNAMREQIAKLSQTQYDTVILDEEDDDFDDEEEWDCVLDEDDEEEFAESVIVESDGTVRKVYPNFRMRLKQSSDKNREWYTAIKNLFCSQKGITYRVYKRVEKIRYQGNVVAVIGIAKRSIKLWLALKPYEFDARRYHHKDVSDKPRFVDVPLYIRVGSDRALTRAQELILALFQEQATEPRKRYTDRSIQELIFTLKYNKLLTNKLYKRLLCESIHVHDCNALDNETAEKCIEKKNVDFIDSRVIETVKLDDIDAKFQDGNRVTLDRLRKVGLVSAECTGYNVVAGQRLTKPLIIVANDFSMEAVKMIALTGGRAIKLVQVNK